HTTTGCGKQGFPSAQPYLSHTPGANPFCCMFFKIFSSFDLLAIIQVNNSINRNGLSVVKGENTLLSTDTSTTPGLIM
ncbi:hypothetical protein BO79DRAFT_159353, partial [Aspergillus costaricaensis CBS 115574]